MSVDNITWFKTSATTWETPNQHREYTAEIEYTIGVGYELTITGLAPPAPEVYVTLRNAKNGFRKFLFDIPVVLP